MCEVDINNDLLLGFTAHWVDNKFRSPVLQAQELSERHTNEYIPLKITKMLIDWNIILLKFMLSSETMDQHGQGNERSQLTQFWMLCSLPTAGGQ